jgi:hypothetical protein
LSEFSMQLEVSMKIHSGLKEPFVLTMLIAAINLNVSD